MIILININCLLNLKSTLSGLIQFCSDKTLIYLIKTYPRS